jgi:hypothetical protein
VGLVGTGLTLAVSGDGATAPRGVDVADQTTPTVTPTPTREQSLADVLDELAVRSAQVPQVFGSIIPGDVGALPNKEMLDSRPIVDFLWDGFAVRVGLTPASENTGGSDLEPRRRCEEFGHTDGPCVPGRLPGSYEESTTATGPAVDGGVTVRFLNVYLANGWDVLVTVANAADTKQAPVLSPKPPLTLDRMRDVAYSDLWFR